MFDSISFIGSGRVARIMLGGWQRANALPRSVLVYDTNAQAVSALQPSSRPLKARRWTKRRAPIWFSPRCIRR